MPMRIAARIIEPADISRLEISADTTAAVSFAYSGE